MSYNLTADQKTAYNKGWASTAKSQDVAVDTFAKKVGDDSPLLAWFAFGYADKHNGKAKWEAVEVAAAPEGEVIRHEDSAGLAAVLRVAPEPTAVEVDGVKVAETTRIDLDAPESEETLAAEASVPDDYTEPQEAEAPAAEEAPKAPAKTARPALGRTHLPWISILAMRESITKDMPKEQVKEIRTEIAMKKRHYIMGWNSAQSPLFDDLDEAEAGYERRHGDPTTNKYWNDWHDGYSDNSLGHSKGQSWTEEIK